MKRLKSTSDIIRATGSVSAPYFDGERKAIDWLNNLPYNVNALSEDYGVYVTVQGDIAVELNESTVKLCNLCNFEIYSKWTDRNGNPCFQVRDVKGIESGTHQSFDVSWLHYNVDEGEMRLTSIDPTA